MGKLGTKTLKGRMFKSQRKLRQKRGIAVERGAHKKYEFSYEMQVVECRFWVGDPEGTNHADHYAPAPVVPPARCEDSNEGD